MRGKVIPLRNDLVAYVTAGVIVVLTILSIYQAVQIDMLELKNNALAKSIEAEKLRYNTVSSALASQNERIKSISVNIEAKQKLYNANVAKIESDYDKKRARVEKEDKVVDSDDNNCSCDCEGIEKILLEEWGR